MTPEYDHDTQLMIKVQKGDLRSFEVLVDKHKNAVVGTIYKMLGDVSEAEDVAQHVFIQIYKAAPRYEPKAKFTTWMYTIVRNLSLNEIRRRGTHKLQSLQAMEDPADDTAPIQLEDVTAKNPSIELGHQELEDKIQLALNDLPESQRLALVLRRYDDMSYDDIAKVLKCSVSATKSIIFRARETMKEKLKPYLQGE
ncbi:MAG: sigma-70 family RNA polymerase sigma factor [Verrucomicrobiota bacterium]|nr:sigma-70 family RNA polymerase sigma factor [Verrucomicrobiota bacterium]